MNVCPYCTSELIDELNFCVECEQQVKCLKCNATLYKDKSKCLKCGEPIKSNSTPQRNMNTYSLEEKVTSNSSYRRIDIQASDTAVSVLTDKSPFGVIKPLSVISGTSDKVKQFALSDEQSSSSVNTRNEETAEDELGYLNSLSTNTSGLFAEHSDFGISPTKTLREFILRLSTKKEKQQVLAILYVWEYVKQHEKRVSRERINSILKNEGLQDGNTKKHLNEVVKSYFKVVDNEYEVNDYDGVRHVEEIIKRVQNPEQVRSSTDIKKSSKAGRTSGQPNKAELDAITPWLELNLDSIKSFDVRKLSTASKWVTFGLYVLTKVLKVKESVSPGEIYTFLFKKYPTMPIKRKTFVDNLSSNKKVLRSAGGAYSLTETSENEMKSLVEGRS